MPARSTRRLVRGILVGAALAILTIAGHTAAGGSVDLTGLALVTLLALLLGSAVSRARLNAFGVLGVLLGGQALLHLVLTFTAHPHSTSGAGPSTSAMVAAHAVAALLATGVISHADDIAAGWQRFLSVILGADPIRHVVIARPGAVAAQQQVDATALTGVLVGQVVRRGPPAGLPALCTL